MRQTRTGVASRGRRVAGAFIARMPSGHRGVFKRHPGAGRLPIKEQTVPISPQAEQIIQKHQDTTGAAAWVKNFNREMRRRLAKKRA